MHVNQIYAWKKQLQDQAVRAFDAGAGRDGEAALTVERDFLEVRKMNIATTVARLFAEQPARRFRIED
jgi:hypothetical protein